MRRILCLLCGLASTIPARPVGAQPQSTETAPVIAVVQHLFDAMAQRDTAALRAILLPGTRFVAFPADTVAVPRTQSDTAFIRSFATRADRLLERMWTPVVQVQGSIATLWTPYDFHINGQWSHCGIDTVSLLRTAAGWQIAGLVYTVQRRGCTPSPLGTPK